MSGQLVGEVLTARSGILADLTQAQTLALIAVAEKCHADSRQGSVRISHVEATLGRSRRTAVRTLEQLKDRGLIRVVKRGYKSHGVSRASIYELPVLAPPTMAQAEDGGCATQDGATAPDVLAPFPDVLAPFPDVLAPPMSGTHDGSIDGSIDGSSSLSPLRNADVHERGEERGQELGRSNAVDVSASRLVATLVPSNTPAAVKTALRLKASELIRGDGLPPEVVAEALRRWQARPDAGVGLLPYIASEVLREGTAPPPKSKQRDWAELLAEQRAKERAAEQVEQLDRKALEQ